MARYTGSVCRLCRREGMQLFLKGERCYTDKCSVKKRSYAPGQHGQRRTKLSEYGIQLREKQKVKRIYGLTERQFRLYFEKAEKQKGITGENLLRSLEFRMDNVLYRGGFASSRNQARQLISHGHFLVNGRKVDIPSYFIRVGDVIRVRDQSKEIESIKNAPKRVDQRTIPKWIEFDKEKFEVIVIDIPQREEIPLNIHEQLVVELYSKV